MPAASVAAPEPRSVPDCPSDDALLSYIPGLLSEADAVIVMSHLQDCSSCQSRLTVLRKRLSSEGHGRAEVPPTTGKNADITPGREPTQRDPAHREPAPSEPPRSPRPQEAAAATLAYAPKRHLPKQLGQYQVLSPIGRGGMGLVFKGYHSRLQRHVAIKLLPGLHLADNTAIIRLQREQAAAGRVEHENIVYAFDAGEQDGVDYLVMEYVEGVDLARLVATCGKLPIAEACEIVRQASLGLAHIEACGLVHRDIKPSNLMLSTGGVVKILDLGLARLREGPIDEAEATHSGFLLGTADYIAPEQIDTPKSADVRSDLYSLGCTFYKLLAGRAPFSDEEHSSVTRKIDAHRHEPPPPISTLRPDAPQALEELLAQLLAKDAADRPQHPDQVAAALAPLAAAADLKSLARRAPHEEALQEQPHPDAAHTPSALTGSTLPLDSAPTPQAAAVPPRRTWAVILTIIGLVVIGGAIAAVVNGLGVGGDADNHTIPIDDLQVGGGQAIAGSGKATFNLRQPLQELKWEGHISSPPPFFNDNQQMLEVRPDSYQLLAVGNYDGQPGAFEITIRQFPWHGDAGLFFGYRHEPQPGYKQLAVFQLIRLWHYPVTNAHGERLRHQLQVVRERGILRLNPLHLEEQEYNPQPVTYPKTQDVRLRIEFGDKRIERILLDGVTIPELATPELSNKFTAADRIGVFGLYAAVSDIDMGPTLFGNFEFTPAENTP